MSGTLLDAPGPPMRGNSETAKMAIGIDASPGRGRGCNSPGDGVCKVTEWLIDYRSY